MYAKTNPRAGRLTPRQKRIFAIAAVLVIVVFGGLTAWGVVAHDSYGGSANGCVNVTVPNSTGGSTLHYCGSQARSFCQDFVPVPGPGLAAGPAAVRAGRPGPRKSLRGSQRRGVEVALGACYRSRTMVTGPSLTRATFMSAPKTPVCTRAPRSRRACTMAVTRGSATGPGAAADQDGRRPLARSA